VFPLNSLDTPPNQHIVKVVPLNQVMELTALSISY